MSMASAALARVSEDSMEVPSFWGRHGPHSSDSILIYLTVAGSLTPMRILESDSIALVKLRIQRSQGFFVKNQKLVFDGRELARKDSCVSEYGVADGTVLHLVLRLSELQDIMVRTVCGKEFEFRVERSRNVRYLKEQIAKKGTDVFDHSDQELTYGGETLEDQWLIHDFCKNEDTMVHLVIQKSVKVRAKHVNKGFEVSIEASNLNENVMDESLPLSKHPGLVKKHLCRSFLLEPLIANDRIELPKEIKELIMCTLSGLYCGHQPIRSSEGSGGAYFMQDSSGCEFVSVFKPVDEEPMAKNNPKGLPFSKDGEGLKRGTQVGEGALREVAAYLLDHPRSGIRCSHGEEKGFAGVPPTAMVKCLHDGFHHPQGYVGSVMKNMKIGSLQMYVKNRGSCEEMGPGAFPVEEVHKISILDIRLANADRHAGNILVTTDDEDRIVLVPIDHGYCLPKKFEDCTFDWLYWPQAQQPYSPDMIEYIKSLDANEDIRLLQRHGWDVPLECARVLRVSTMLLKKGVARGLTPFAIGSILCRETLKKESVIEQIYQEAEDSLLHGTTEAAILEAVSAIMDRRLDEL